MFNWKEEKKLKPMNFEDAFPTVLKVGGFDAIVGNPPYVSLLAVKFCAEWQKYFHEFEYRTIHPVG